MNKRKPVPVKEHPRELSDEDKKVVMQRRQARELDDYRQSLKRKHEHHPRHAKPTKAERRLLGRQLDYESAGLSTKGGYRRPGSLQR